MIQLRLNQKSFAHLTGDKTAEGTVILNKDDRCSRIPELAREHCWWRQNKVSGCASMFQSHEVSEILF